MGSHQILANVKNGPPRITPTDIANLVLWLDAGTLALSNNDPVTTWADGSGNSNDATQASAGLRPLFKTSILNSLPVVRFDENDDSMGTPLSISSPFTIFAVYNTTYAPSLFRRAITGSNNWLLGPANANHQVYNGSSIVGPSVVTNVFVYATVIVGSGETNFRVDGSLVGTNASIDGPGTVFFGAAGAANDVLAGDIAEVVIYNRELTPTEIGQIEGYLVSKYNL